MPSRSSNLVMGLLFQWSCSRWWRCSRSCNGVLLVLVLRRKQNDPVSQDEQYSAFSATDSHQPEAGSYPDPGGFSCAGALSMDVHNLPKSARHYRSAAIPFPERFCVEQLC